MITRSEHKDEQKSNETATKRKEIINLIWKLNKSWTWLEIEVMNKENMNSNINCKIRGHRLYQETSDAFISSFVFQKRLHAILRTTFPFGSNVFKEHAT